MSRNLKSLIRIAVSLTILIVTVILEHTVGESLDWFIYLQLGLSAAAYLTVGYDVLWKALTNILHGKVFDENFLMTVATVGAFAIGEYAEASAVMLLYQIGELFQRYAVGKSRKSISSLMDIRPEEATVLRNGGEIAVHPSEVEIGETIIVKAGDKLPLDGIVIEGECNLDTSAITGESLPKHVKTDGKVISGCINLDGVIYVKTTSGYDDSTVSKVLDLVENAASNKAPAENFITKFSRYYTPVVVITALILAVVPPIINGEWLVWVRRAMMFLFVSCPCALVISIPLGFFGGIAAASKKGILVKGSNYLEILAKVDVVAFDKTGTLTKGNFAVTDVTPEQNAEKILSAAAIAEQYSKHPIAQSIMKKCSAPCSAAVTEIPGLGLKAETDGRIILCGNAKLMEENNVEFTENDVGTVVYVAENGKYLGSITIEDELKDDSQSALTALKREGCKTALLTGDSEKAAKRVCDQLGGIDIAKSQLLPQDKVAALEELKQSEKVAFVGDGINDAPVLAAADVGIAMGALGSDAAIEAADIVLMQDNPSAIPAARKIARKTLTIVTENIVMSIAIKLAVLVVSAIGLLDKIPFGMIIAILADVGVCVVAILNSMRAMFVKKDKKQIKPNLKTA